MARALRVGDHELEDEPDWFRARRVRGRFERVEVRALGQTLSVRVWSPRAARVALPLLVVHDGPDYEKQAALTRYAGAMIERGTLAPFRVALLPAGDRNEWYSASARYGRALCRRILPALTEAAEVAGRPVGMGASLGALALLQAHRAWPGSFAGLFLQSGSYFVPRFDRHESGFPRYGRIVRFVRSVQRAGGGEHAVPVTMTCGIGEENIHNNRLMARALAVRENAGAAARRGGDSVRLVEVPGGHDYAGWRDALDPHLTGLLADVWPAR